MKKLHRNKPQLLTSMIDANVTICRWGRGTGKTNEIGLWNHRRIVQMPRSGGAIVGSTYTHLLTKLAPGIIKAWQDLGLEQDKHFWFNKFPPKKFRIAKAYTPLLSPKYSIFWANGSYTQFLSADRGMNNALSADFMAFDEARFLDYEKFREITLTVRGNTAHYGEAYYHHSLLLTSDAPRSAKSQWFNEYESKMDKEKINLIIQTMLYVLQYQEQIRKTKSVRKRNELAKKMNKYLAIANHLRKDAIYFSRASTLDNIHALGPKVIWNFKKLLSDTDYLISVLNEDPEGMPNSFYPLLNSEIHGYHSENEGYIEKMDVDFSQAIQKDCLWKSPYHYDAKAELDIALDYNYAINSLVVGQGNPRVYRLLNSMYVLGEKKEYLKDVVKEFCRYYKHHKNKTVNYYFDNTAVGGDASGRIEFSKEVEKVLQQNGWKVKKHRIKQASEHMHRFEFWIRLLSGKDERLPKFLFDLDDCSQWLISAENAGVKQTEKGFKKDKSTETRKDKEGNYLIRPEDSTHLSEAADTLIDGKFGNALLAPMDGYVEESYL